MFNLGSKETPIFISKPEDFEYSHIVSRQWFEFKCVTCGKMIKQQYKCNKRLNVYMAMKCRSCRFKENYPLEEAAIKRSETNNNKTPEQKALSVSKNKDSKLKNHGDPNYNNRVKAIQTYKEKTGYEYPTQNPEVQNDIGIKMDELYGGRGYASPIIRKKCEETNEKVNGDPHYNNIEKRNETNLNTYGNKCSLMNPDIRDKSDKSSIESFGETNYFRSKEWKELKPSKFKELFGGQSPYCLEENVEKSMNTKEERYGDRNYNNDLKRRATNLKLYGKENRFEFGSKERDEYMINKYGPDWKRIVANHKTKSVSFKFMGETFDSSWEVILWLFAIDFGIPIERQPVSIQYDCYGYHECYPDFRFNNVLVEVKGNHFIKDDDTMYCPFHNTGESEDEFNSRCEKYAIKKETMLENGVKFMYESDIYPMMNYIINQYGKRFLNEIKCPMKPTDKRLEGIDIADSHIQYWYLNNLYSPFNHYGFTPLNCKTNSFYGEDGVEYTSFGEQFTPFTKKY